MNDPQPLSRSDIRPLEFALAVILGGVGSALLSAAVNNPWASVGFALLVMAFVSTLRWRIASEFKDYHSLEAFAEDIYLLGYLLTLAALLGLAPRLMKEESNLFHIAGVKLCTTIFGLGVMMVFRQTARRWAEGSKETDVDAFLRREKEFNAAVGRLNQGASELTAKMEEVALRFDPDLLGPVAEWSNRAANALSTATRAMQTLPTSMEAGIQRIDELSRDLERVKSAVTDLAGAMTTMAVPAAKAFAGELGNAGNAIMGLGAKVTELQPSAEAGRAALERLGGQVLTEAKRFDEIDVSLARVVGELGKVDQALRQLSDTQKSDVNAPVNRLVEALHSAAEKATGSMAHMEMLKGELTGVSVASQVLGNRLGNELGKPLASHGDSLHRVGEGLERNTQQIARLANQLEASSLKGPERNGFEAELLAQLGELQKEMKETNGHIKSLVGRFDEVQGPEHRPGILTRIFGGGGGSSSPHK